VTDDEALSVFVQGDDAEAERAFECLRARTVDALVGRVCASVHNREDAEDIVQQAYLRIWSRRRQLQNMGLAAWRGYLNRIALRCCLDHLRSRDNKDRPASLESFHDIPSEEMPLVSAVEDAIRLGVIFSLADEVWLGSDPSVSPAVRTRQILAAQMMALDGVPWETVCRVLGDGPDPTQSISRGTLDRWVTDPNVVRGLAYERLYFSNQNLAAFLLMPLSPESTSEAPSRIDPDGTTAGWTPDEQLVIGWRYGAGMQQQQIEARTDNRLPSEELESLFAKCCALFPFRERMAEILASPVLRSSVPVRELLASDGLWKRLVFQYAYVDDISYKDILDRTAPAADQVGCTITERGTLKGWIAMKRLLKELAVTCRERMGVDTDD
jgi:DNA-directed RNA polymerase specialized sigma24 family protein